MWRPAASYGPGTADPCLAKRTKQRLGSKGLPYLAPEVQLLPHLARARSCRPSELGAKDGHACPPMAE